MGWCGRPRSSELLSAPRPPRPPHRSSWSPGQCRLPLPLTFTASFQLGRPHWPPSLRAPWRCENHSAPPEASCSHLNTRALYSLSAMLSIGFSEKNQRGGQEGSLHPHAQADPTLQASARPSPCAGSVPLWSSWKFGGAVLGPFAAVSAEARGSPYGQRRTWERRRLAGLRFGDPMAPSQARPLR